MADLTAWYTTCDAAEFEQGDIFFDATIPNIAAYDPAAEEIQTREGSFVVLTQSCDLPKVPAILLAEVLSYASLWNGPDASVFRKSDTRDRLIRNRFEHLFLIPPYDNDPKNWSVVAFRQLQLTSIAVLTGLAAKRTPVRLASPYKEYLGESFARFMMRVALPEPLDEFKTVNWG